MVRPSGGAPRMGTHAIDWIMSWWTLTASARRASSRALIVDDGLAALRRPLGDRAREARVRLVVARAVARGVRLELARRRSTRTTKPRSAAEQRDGVVGHALEQAREVVLARELARDLEDAREAVLGEARAREDATSCRATERRTSRRRGAAASPTGTDAHGDRRRVRLPERAAARVVPEDLAQIARELRRRLLEHRERGLGVAPRRRDAALRRREPRPRVERPPRPLAAARLARELERLVERRAARRPRRRRASAIGPAHELRERLVLAEARLAEPVADARRAPARAPRASAPRLARAREQPLEPRLGRVGGAPLRLPRRRRLLVERAPRADVARARRVLGLEPEELRARRRRELVAPLARAASIEPRARAQRPR